MTHDEVIAVIRELDMTLRFSNNKMYYSSNKKRQLIESWLHEACHYASLFKNLDGSAEVDGSEAIAANLEDYTYAARDANEALTLAAEVLVSRELMDQPFSPTTLTKDVNLSVAEYGKSQHAADYEFKQKVLKLIETSKKARRVAKIVIKAFEEEMAAYDGNTSKP